jgi:hypothetical protein
MGRQIRGNLKPHILQKGKLPIVEVPGADPRTWSRVDTKEELEELLINRSIEQFSHAGNTPFVYTTMGDELGHTGDTPMADDVYTGTLKHRSLVDHDIKTIVTQFHKHHLLLKMINPVVNTETSSHA